MATDVVAPSAVTPSLEDIHSSVPIPRRWWRRFLAFSGPAFLISVGYMDPGNWGTDLEAGSKFGYRLLWVLLLSNLMALLLQTLATRLGIVSGRDLAQACRESYPRRTVVGLWILAEIAIAACDLAEVIGTIIALKLLFGMPYLAGLVVAAGDTLAAAGAAAARRAAAGTADARADRRHRGQLRRSRSAVTPPDWATGAARLSARPRPAEPSRLA